MRNQLLEKLSRLQSENADIPPVVSLDEFFEDNTVEDSIACNQVGYGRPQLKDLYRHFMKIQQKDEVQAVLVGLHFDWAKAYNNIDNWPYAENIHIYTSAQKNTVADWVDLEYIKADSLVEGWPYGGHPSAPKPNEGYKVYTICWD